MKRIEILVVLLFMSFVSKAQDELMDILAGQSEGGDRKVTATFKSTRLVNGHTIETRTKNVLEFVIGHRFGMINTGVKELYGLDDAQVRFALEYGVTDNLNVGVGRSSFQKVYDGFIKYKLLAQSNSIPISAAAFVSAAARTLDFPENNLQYETKHKFAYTYQLLIARKFDSNLSFQVMPTMVHRNLVLLPEEENDLLAIGVGGRMKLTTRLAINVEYYYQVNQEDPNAENALAIGFDLETGGHVFQLHFTNARQMNERGFIGETSGDFFDGDIHFGFNVSRVFNLRGKR
ncbi:MAG: hypothetical protein KI790_03185 [Cyclobacteriaceae bacterium]|nr:hypothetical protein [Cyclobacteriaceae bacterium HetDA_MAG_MS6]